MNINSFVFLDCETTGLPAFEYNKTKITELCLISVQANHIRLGVYPRVQNKINLCFNPLKRISPHAEEITRLYNDELVSESSFNDVSLNLIINFLERLSKPICFVAHNGFKFDYPILRNHIECVGVEFPKHILCIDSLCAFKELHNQNLLNNSEEKTSSIMNVEETVDGLNTSVELLDEWDEVLYEEVSKIENSLAKTPPRNTSLMQTVNETTPPVRIPNNEPPPAPKAKRIREVSHNRPSMSKARRQLNFTSEQSPPASNSKLSFNLSSVYERIVRKPATNAHQAEADVTMLLQCAAHLGDSFVDYANDNAILFDDIPKMEPDCLPLDVEDTTNDSEQ